MNFMKYRIHDRRSRLAKGYPLSSSWVGWSDMAVADEALTDKIMGKQKGSGRFQHTSWDGMNVKL